MSRLSLPKDIETCHSLIKALYFQNTELKKQNALLLTKTAKLESEVNVLKKRIKVLEKQLNKDSQNSDKPPSTDGLKKRPALPKTKDKKQGGQANHKGKTLQAVSNPDQTIILDISKQCSCGCNLKDIELEVKQTRQVFELPAPKLESTEYVQMTGDCPNCGKTHEGVFPDSVKAPVQYGDSVRALTTLLSNEYSLPVNKIKQLFIDLYGSSLNEATIQKNNERCFVNLEATEQAIKTKIINSSVSHFDETGLRVEGKLHWMHVACTQLYTFLYLHQKRGGEALEDAGVIQACRNWIVHDCWSSYFSYTEGKHALCGAHLIRELRALYQDGVPWARYFYDLLLSLHKLTDGASKALSKKQQKAASQLYDTICEYANQIEPQPVKTPGKRGRPKATDGRNLLNRFVEHKEAVLAFAFHREVPFSNNLAERALRPTKTKQKVSGCLRTFKGGEFYARIRGFIDTARKNERNVFEELKNIFKGKSFILDPNLT